MKSLNNFSKKLLIIGLPGSGKSLLASIFAKKGWTVISAGSVIRQLAIAENKDISREGLQNYGEKFIKEKGSIFFANILTESIYGRDLVVIEGVRPLDAIRHLKTIIPELLVVYLESDSDIRFKRLQDRDKISVNDFSKLEHHPMEHQVVDAKSEANIIITNNCKIEDVYNKIIAITKA